MHAMDQNDLLLHPNYNYNHAAHLAQLSFKDTE